MSITKVTNYLVEPGTNRGRHPATMGTSWSCNMYREINTENQYMASVPGLKFVRRVATAGKCRGAYVSSVGLQTGNQRENAFVVIGRKVMRFDAFGACDQIGEVASGISRISFAETGGINPYLLMADGTNLWAYSLIDGGTMRKVTLPERVNGDGGTIAPSHVACVAGSICINDKTSGFIYYSIPYPLNNAEREVFQTQTVDGKLEPVYDPDNTLKVLTRKVDAFDWMFLDSYGVQQYFNAESSSDNVRAIASVGPNLYLFGFKTIEIWQRGSGEYETWTRQSYTTNASNGLAAPYSIAVCGSELFYLGSGESYAKAVLVASGQSYTKVSDTWLEQKLLGETGDTAYGFSYSEGGHIFYVLQLGNLGETWAYDTETKEWHQRTSRVLESGKEIAWRVAAMVWFQGRFFAFCNDGCEYEFTEDYWYEDYGNSERRLPMIRHRQGALVVADNRPFILNEISVECNVGCWADYKLAPDLLLEVSRDGGNTWSSVRSCRMGRTGEYFHRVRFAALGYNRLCVLRVTYSHPTSLELTACSQRISPTTAVI